MNRTLIVGLIVLLAICAGLTYRFVLHRPGDVTRVTNSPAVPFPSAPGGRQAGRVSTSPSKTGVIYVVSATGGDDNDLVPKAVTWTDVQSPARAAVNALIETGNSPLPSGTKLRGIKIVDGLATVDFTQDFQTNFHGGETEEAQTVNSILRTLGQFSDIDRVQILVEGKPIEALSQLPISGPLDVIRPDPVRQARNAAPHN